MKRTCKWCKRPYDTKIDQSSKYCDDNPNAEQNRKRYFANYKPDPKKIVRIGCLVVPPSPFNSM